MAALHITQGVWPYCSRLGIDEGTTRHAVETARATLSMMLQFIEQQLAAI